MSLTLGMTGMDPATETALKAAFDDANGRLDGRWALVPEADADHVMVDMDSMYGPMSWLRLHAAGKRVIGLTTAPRTQTDFRLGRPFDSGGFVALLSAIASDRGIELPSVPTVESPSGATTVPQRVDPRDAASATSIPSSIPAQTPSSVPNAAQKTPTPPTPAPAQTPETMAAAPPSGMTPAPAPADLLPEEKRPLEAEPVPAPTAEPEAPVWPWPQSNLLQWLAPDALSQRARYRRASGPTLLIDPQTRSYRGPSTLKPFAGYFEGMVRAEDFEPVDDATWARESAAAGPAQPLSRLQWLGGLMVGQGALLPGYDPSGRYRLGKWPQTEREYPRHFRIATAMMRGPATLDEIATASGMPPGDVADFVNANLVTGFAEAFVEVPIEPAEPPKPTGLFGRLRGR